MTSTLTSIRTKVRRLTASPSENQLSNDDIDEYVNTFYINDLPQHLKLFNLKTTYTFYTSPGVETYALPISPTVDPSTATADVVTGYYSVEPPVYIAGYESFYTQSEVEFYRLFPPINDETTEDGTGIAGPYAITVSNTPVLRNYVTVSASDAAGNRYIGIDDGAGTIAGTPTAADVTGAIDYDTGAITALTFGAVIPTTEDITVQTVPYVAARPNSVLFFQNNFIVRPIPDKTYRIFCLIHLRACPDRNHVP